MKLHLTLGLAIGAIALAMPGAAMAQKHPLLHRALFDLREARAELNEANNDFGGHKAKAIEAVNAAIVQIEKILVVEKDFNFKGLKDKNDNKPVPKGPFPNIRAAIQNLREARTELAASTNNFGGLRDGAIKAIDTSINQLELGIVAAVKKKN